MNPLLDNYIQSLHTNERVHIQRALAKAKVSKDYYDDLVRDLQAINVFDAPLLMATVAGFSQLNAESISGNYASIHERLKQVFDASNTIGLLIDSYSQSLLSDILAVENELSSLDKAIGNYAFLLSDAKAYDYAYLEPFSDNLNQDISMDYLSDRDKDRFDQTQLVFQDTQEGCISISSDFQSSYSLTGKVVRTNYEPFIRSDSGVSNSTSGLDAKGWRTSIAAPAPVRSVLSDFEDLYAVPLSSYLGALAIVDYTLESPATCDSIRINSFSEFDQEITQVVLYHGEQGQETKALLEGPVTVSGPFNLFFPMTSVSKFRVYLRQPLYTRLLPNAERKAEDLHREGLSRFVIENEDKAKALAQMLNGMIKKIINQSPSLSSAPVAGIPLSNVHLTDIQSFEQFLYDVGYKKPYSFTISTDSDAIPVAFDQAPSVLTTETKKLIDTMRQQLLSLGYYQTGSVGSEADKSLDPNNKDAKGDADTPQITEPLLYHYSLGLKDVIIGRSTQGFKAVYVSKILNAPADLSDVKLKVSDLNFKLKNSAQDIHAVTSVEYSVTNDSNPIEESSWFPILPSGETTVHTERLMLDTLGNAYFRFPASYSDPITVLKNNQPFPINPITDYKLSENQMILGINVSSLNRSGTDVFTCSYTPAGDRTVVSFEDTPSLVAAHSPDGVGEYRSDTFGQISVNLSHNPVIEPKINDTTLDPVLGLTGYQPIIVRLEDGSIARNFTNYKSGQDLPLNVDATELQFIHKDGTLLFNKPLTSAIRIFYKYIPCNVRFRVVLRCNSDTFVSPKVDYVHLKAKTRTVLA